MDEEAPAPRPGSLAFKWAALIDKFHVTVPEIAGLTDAQIDLLYLHPRDKDGTLIAPKDAPEAPRVPTRESRLLQIDQLEAMNLISKVRAQELRDEVDRREPT